MIDRKVFFDQVRKTIFSGSLAQETVKGIDAILDVWEEQTRLTDLRHLAYMLATVRGECGYRMLPVREGFSSTDEIARAYVARKGYKYAAVVNGHVYYGRGLVQLTWDFNYRAMSDILGIDLYNNPDLALQPDIAAAIMFEGMRRGTFTGKKLSDYLNDVVTDWVEARRIINGLDRAHEFADWGEKFHAALLAAYDPKLVKAPTVPPPPDIPKPVPAAPEEKGFWAKFADLFKPKGA